MATAGWAGVYSQGNSTYVAVGQSLQVWNAETPTPGNGTTAASLGVVFTSIQGQNGTPFRAQGYFSGAPGTFEIDVQAAETDVDTQYQTLVNANITTVDAINSTWHFDGTLTDAKFVRLLMRSRTNSVTITAWIGR